VIKLLLEPIFMLTDILLLVVKCRSFVLLKFRDNWFGFETFIES